MNNPEEVLAKLKSEAKSSRTIQSLEAIHKVCADLKKQKHLDFSVATVAAIGADRGVPKAQSIRNATGEPYRVLIAAWQHASGGERVVSRRKSTMPESLAWVDEIDDLRLRSLAKDLAATVTELRANLQLCKQMSNLHIDMRENPTPQKINSEISLTEVETESLKAAIDPDFHAEQDWSVDRRGRIKNKSGRTLFKAGFVSAIQKIISLKNGKDYRPTFRDR